MTTPPKHTNKTSTRAVLKDDFDRLVMAHGEVVETGAKAAYEQATTWLFKS